MNSGLTELLCGVHYRELVAHGLHEQSVNSELPRAKMRRKQHLHALLGRIGARLQDELLIREACVIPSEVGGRSASDSSPECISWLCPHRMP